MRRRTRARAGGSAKARSGARRVKQKTKAPGEKKQVVAPKRKKSRLKATSSSARLKSGRQRKARAHDSSPALEPIRRRKKVIKEEDTLSSSMEQALDWMAHVDAPKTKAKKQPPKQQPPKQRKAPKQPQAKRKPKPKARPKRQAEDSQIGPARADTQRMPRGDLAKKDPKRRTRKIKRPPAEQKENAFSWMDELAGPFPDVQLDPCDPNQRRGQPTPEPRRIPAAAKGKTRRVPRESKTPTQRVRRPEKQPKAKRPKPKPQRPQQAKPKPKPQPKKQRPQQAKPKPQQRPAPQTARWGEASSGVRQKLPQRRKTGRIGPAVDVRDHLGERPITAELSESEIRMLGMPPEVALRQPRRPAPAPAPAPLRPTESLGDEALEHRLSRLANTLDRPSSQRGLLEISDTGPVIVDPSRPRSSEEMRRTLRLDPCEAADYQRGTPASEAPTRKALPAVTPAPIGLESNAWDEGSSLVQADPFGADPFAAAFADPFADDPFANDPFEHEPPVSDSSLFDLEDPYLMAAIDPNGSNPFEEVLTSSSKDVFPNPPEYRAPGCGDPFCVDPSCTGDPFAFQVRAAELQQTQDQRPLPPVTDRRRRLRRGA